MAKTPHDPWKKPTLAQLMKKAKIRFPRHKYPGMKFPTGLKRKGKKVLSVDAKRARTKRKQRPLTRREKETLYYVRMFQLKHRYSPTSTDIGFTFGLTPQRCGLIVIALQVKGYLELTPGPRYDPHRRIMFPRNFHRWDWGDFSQFPWYVFPQAYDVYRSQQVALHAEVGAVDFTHTTKGDLCKTVDRTTKQNEEQLGRSLRQCLEPFLSSSPVPLRSEPNPFPPGLTILP